MKLLALRSLFLIALLSQQPASLEDPDAYGVYNALIPFNWLLRDAHATELLIQSTTEADSSWYKECAPSGSDLTGPWLEALADFKAQNKTAKLLAARFSLPVSYRFESKDTIFAFFSSPQSGHWDAFHAAYPKARGFIQLSAVGFDKARERAIVYIAHSCGGLCGQGGYAFLQKTPDGWRGARLKDVNTCMWNS